MAKQTKEQKEQYVKAFFGDAENASVKTLYLNPRGEWFTDVDFANNSLPKNAKGERVGKIEEFQRDEPEAAVTE